MWTRIEAIFILIFLATSGLCSAEVLEECKKFALEQTKILQEQINSQNALIAELKRNGKK